MGVRWFRNIKTRNVFSVNEGMTGFISGCRVFVFSYTDQFERGNAFEKAIQRFKTSDRFMNQTLQGDRYRMSGRDGESITIHQVDRYFSVVIGLTYDTMVDVSETMAANWLTI